MKTTGSEVTRDKYSSSEAHEWALVACALVHDLDPVFACIPHHWFVDEETRTLWQLFEEGRLGIDAVVEAKHRLGFRSFRRMVDAIYDTFAWNSRWHASRVYHAYVRRAAIGALPGWLRSLDAGEYPETPVQWPCWEAEAIDCAPPAVAWQAMLTDEQAGELWTKDRHLWWLLGARIRERSEPIR